VTLSETDIEELREIMLLELYERRNQLKQCLKILDKNNTDEEAFKSLIRVIHSLKGLFGMTGFSQISHMFKSMQGFISKNSNSNIDQLIPFMFQLQSELAIIYRYLARKKEPKIQGLEQVNQKITFLFLE
jgi:chemotaxis protein histidine kinase CheA